MYMKPSMTNASVNKSDFARYLIDDAARAEFKALKENVMRETGYSLDDAWKCIKNDAAVQGIDCGNKKAMLEVVHKLIQNKKKY